MSLDDVKELRELTGLSFKEINLALTESGGNKDKALEILKARGAGIAEKKSSRSAKEGVIGSYLHSNGKVAALVELFCETDFVAKNPIFLELAHDLALHIAASQEVQGDDLLEQEFVKDPTITLKQLLEAHITKLGENIKIGRTLKLEM